MSAPISRRTFVAAASASLFALTAGIVSAEESPPSWMIAPDISFDPEPFGLFVYYAINTSVGGPLYLQIADADPESGFYLWTRLERSTDMLLFPTGAWDVPEGQTYLISIVTADGSKHPYSPEVAIDVPLFAGNLDEEE